MTNLSEILIDFKELIKSILYSKEESKDLFDTYYDENIVYSNGRFINSKKISNYKNLIPLKYLLEYSTISNLNPTYNKVTDTLTLTGEGYNLEYTLPYNVNTLKGLEFRTKINYDTYDNTDYYIGLKNNQNNLFIGYKLTENNITFIVGDSIIGTVSNTLNDEDYDLYFKVVPDYENNQFRIAYHARKYTNNNSEVLFNNGFLNNKTVNILDLNLSSYSFITYNTKDNGFLTLKTLEIYKISNIDDGLRFINSVLLTPTNIQLNEPTLMTIVIYDQYNNPIKDLMITCYKNNIIEDNLLYTGITDNNGIVTFSFLSETNEAINMITCINNIPYNNTLVKSGVEIDMTHYIKLTINGQVLNLTTYSSTPSLFKLTENNACLIDYGDGTQELYTTGNINHSYDTRGEYTVKIYGEITALYAECFRDTQTLISVTIPPTVTTLYSDCFRNCNNLKEVNLPSSITSILTYCFYGCDALVSIDLSKLTQLKNLSYYCFYSCSKLESIKLPPNLTRISKYCFAWCEKLSSITLKEGITRLDRQCFYKSGIIKKIKIPSTVTKIGAKYIYNLSCTIELTWASDSEIIAYDKTDYSGWKGVFIIPHGTMDLYINKGYPSDKLRIREQSFIPSFDGTTPVIKQYTNSNANTQNDGVATFKGCVIAGGWDNTINWELSVDVSYPYGLRYTGLLLLTNLTNPFSGWGIRNWEGPVTGTPMITDENGGTVASANYTKTPNSTLTDLPTGSSIWSNPTVDWYTLHMKKVSSTRLEVWKNDDEDNKVVYNWSELSDVPRCTIGGATNASDISSYGSLALRNLRVKYE